MESKITCAWLEKIAEIIKEQSFQYTRSGINKITFKRSDREEGEDPTFHKVIIDESEKWFVFISYMPEDEYPATDLKVLISEINNSSAFGSFSIQKKNISQGSTGKEVFSRKKCLVYRTFQSCLTEKTAFFIELHMKLHEENLISTAQKLKENKSSN